MSLTERFAAYAAAFEQAYESDDWSKIEPYFTEDAVYEIPGPPPLGVRHEGRPAVLRGLQQSVDGLDRRFDSRKVDLTSEIEERDGAVRFRWRGTYQLAGAPDFVMEGEETATYQGDRIRHLQDVMADGTADRATAYLAAHGHRLKDA